MLDGEPSGQDQNAVVVVDDGLGGWCTGAVVAPNLVLMARHCTFGSVPVVRKFPECDVASGRAVTRALEPTRFSIWFGSERPLVTVAGGKRSYSGPSLDLCANEVALLEVDAEIDVEPLPLRLDELPKREESGTLVGWGVTHQRGGIPRLEDRRNRRQLDILAVGRDDYPLPSGGFRVVPESAFITDQAGCYGDSGSPFISSESGAIVGVLSALGTLDPAEKSDPTQDVSTCSDVTLFRDLYSQREWLRAAFVAAGQAPWLEGHPRPAALGAPCHEGAACVSGLCASVDGQGFCSQPCAVSACPEPFLCVGAEGARVCAAPLLETGAPRARGCALTVARQGRAASLLVVAFATAVGLFARRRRRPCWRHLRFF